MSRLIVMTDQETAPGFQLAGVEVISALDYESARSHLAALLQDPTVGLIAVNSEFLEALDDATRRRIETSYKPIVIALPSGWAMMGVTSRGQYLREWIRRAIGFHITFTGEESSEKREP